MSAIEEIREIDERRAKLITAAKEDALRQVNEGITTLNELGFQYSLVEGAGKPAPTARAPRAPREPGTRRTGVREEVLELIKGHPDGITVQTIIETMNAKGDKPAETSIRNALSALKKDSHVGSDKGLYRAA